MGELIYKDEAITAIGGIIRRRGYGDQYALQDARIAIQAMAPVDAVPVVHGRWIHLDPRERATISGKCSCCGWEAHYYEDDVADMPYCPNCGAKMGVEKNVGD